MKSGYTPTPTGDEIEATDLELQEAIIDPAHNQTVFKSQEKQRKLLRQ